MSDDEYRLGIFVAHNSSPAQPGAGSCIFLHIWKGPDVPTSGCTAMSAGAMESLLGWLDAAIPSVLVQLPEAEYQRLQTAWHLPRSNSPTRPPQSNRISDLAASTPTSIRRELVRGLGLVATTSLVVGTIIGTGVFLKTARMAQAVGTPSLVLLAWVAAGLLSLAGALSYAELGAMLPDAGGEYVYLRAAYGDLPAFLFGWMRLAVGSTGSIASFGAAFATFFPR